MSRMRTTHAMRLPELPKSKSVQPRHYPVHASLIPLQCELHFTLIVLPIARRVDCRKVGRIVIRLRSHFASDVHVHEYCRARARFWRFHEQSLISVILSSIFFRGFRCVLALNAGHSPRQFGTDARFGTDEILARRICRRWLIGVHLSEKEQIR